MITGKIKASYVHVFQPQTPPGGGDPKYSLTLLIPKSDVNTINQIYQEMEKAKQEGVAKVFGGKLPPVVKLPLYDGDGVRASGEPFGEECRGCMVMTASSKQRPGVVDINLQPILDPTQFYSGCYARASINFFAYNQNGNKGVGCGLNNVQKLEDGEPLSGRATVEEDFGGANSYPSAYAVPPYTAPQTSGTPPAQFAPATGYAAGQSYVSQPGQAVYPASGYAVPAQAVDPITGLPLANGGVVGI